jgi:DNA-binding MarR family transcriptional regulator
MSRPTTTKTRSARRSAPAAELYEAMQELVRVYQFRDRDRACYGQVTPNECYALEAIEKAGALSVNGLAAALGLHKSNASRIVDALEAKRFARRKSDADDGRAVKVEITAKGVATHAAIRAQVEARYGEILARVPAVARRQLVELVRALGLEAAARIGRRGGSPDGKESSCS